VVNTKLGAVCRARSRIRSSSLAHLAGRWSRFGVVPGSPGRRLVLEVPWQAGNLPGAGGGGQDRLHKAAPGWGSGSAVPARTPAMIRWTAGWRIRPPWVAGTTIVGLPLPGRVWVWG
jgi:hypothetical protein